MSQGMLTKGIRAMPLVAAAFVAEGCGMRDVALPPVPQPEKPAPAKVQMEEPAPVTALPVRTFGTELTLTAVSVRSDATTWKAHISFSPSINVREGGLVKVHVHDTGSDQFVKVGEKDIPISMKSVHFVEVTFDAKQALTAPYAYGVLHDDGFLDVRIESRGSR